MTANLLEQLKYSLADSNAAERTVWAREIVEQQIPLEDLFFLFHCNTKTAERFTWLITDIGDQDVGAVASSMELLFSMRDQMPFPGMQRSVAKWLWMTGIPVEIEDSAIEVLFDWMADPAASIACKSFAAKALFDAALQGRASRHKLRHILELQSDIGTPAYRSRIQKLHNKLADENSNR